MQRRAVRRGVGGWYFILWVCTYWACELFLEIIEVSVHWMSKQLPHFFFFSCGDTLLFISAIMNLASVSHVANIADMMGTFNVVF